MLLEQEGWEWHSKNYQSSETPGAYLASTGTSPGPAIH
jgi:hypothetical protein